MATRAPKSSKPATPTAPKSSKQPPIASIAPKSGAPKTGEPKSGAPKTEGPKVGGPNNDGPDDRVRRPDLIEAVTARVDVKRSDVKLVMDALLDELGKALDRADEVIVPPLGKAMVKKRDTKNESALLTLKLKRR